MKQYLYQLLSNAIHSLQTQGILPANISADIQIEYARDKQFGDYATNLALNLAKIAKLPPKTLAEKIVAVIPIQSPVTKVEIAGPGFINFFLVPTALNETIKTILSLGKNYGRNTNGQQQRIILEFVSANPTGPLHVGHGRGAAYGASLANLLEANGYQIHREYYVNDAGRQMDILAVSVWLRYLALFEADIIFPSNGYRGDYIKTIASKLKTQVGSILQRSNQEIYASLPPDEMDGGDKEEYIDALIARAKALLSYQDYHRVHALALNEILADIREDLAEFGLTYEEWFAEHSLMDSGLIEQSLQKLWAKNYLYEQDNATWFKSRDFGDERDRVVIRANGNTTYFASDIAYHMNKYERGFDWVINILGADHHGYIARTAACIAALGYDNTHFKVLLVQFATLFRGKERVQMSTRSGSFITLRELREEIGNDAARFFYVMRKADQHMDFDLELAKTQSADNPVYYIQYAHARICSVFRQLNEKRLVWDQTRGLNAIDKLDTEHEKSLIATLARYPEVIANASQSYEPHQLTNYLRELATQFHTYYNAHQFLVTDENLRDARLCLIVAVKQVLHNALTIVGVSSPEEM